MRGGPASGSHDGDAPQDGVVDLQVAGPDELGVRGPGHGVVALLWADLGGGVFASSDPRGVIERR